MADDSMITLQVSILQKPGSANLHFTISPTQYSVTAGEVRNKNATGFQFTVKLTSEPTSKVTCIGRAMLEGPSTGTVTPPSFKDTTDAPFIACPTNGSCNWVNQNQ